MRKYACMYSALFRLSPSQQRAQMMWHWYCLSDTVPPHEQIMKGIDEHENHLYPQG